ncbi:MAG TPA: VCBS repeat-containing protein, partial [Bacteroidia bacterium]|nr:VCBS repeat-containing protein [Bacteroidia bacterium]
MRKFFFIAFLSLSTAFLSPLISSAQCSVCFNAATNYTVGSNPYSIVSADFNSDGLADLAVANWSSSSVSILLGTGAGNFGAATNFPVGTNPRCVVTGDFNADGKPDFATA